MSSGNGQSQDRLADSVNESASPSLRASVVGAFEVKYTLTEEQAREAEAFFGRGLSLDPHADPALGGAYAVSSLYCDTTDWAVYFREGRHATRKYRVRRYGNSPEVYLERKTVKAMQVRKRRVAVPGAEVAAALAARSGESEWFARQVSGRGLGPVCRVRYLRRAMFGVTSQGPVRVTFDRSVRGAAASGWSFERDAVEVPLLEGVVVCEFKFAGSMPVLLREAAAAVGMVHAAASKYRACVRACAPELGIVFDKLATTTEQTGA